MAEPLIRIDGYTAAVGPPDAISDVSDLIAVVETSIDGSTTVTESFVRMILDSPEVDAEADNLTVHSAATADLVAFGHYRNPDPHIESITLGWVHPDHLGLGLGRAVVGWGIDRSRSMLPDAPPGTRVTNRCQISENNHGAARLLSDLGYEADRHDFEMRLDLDASVDVAPLPDGVTVRTMSGSADLEIVEGVTTAAFRDHYGWVESTPEARAERWHNYRAMDEWDDDLVWIAETADGAVGALVGLATHGSHTEVGYVGSLGVLREWRGKGLARALLTRAFAEYRRRGKQAVNLDVDADSLTGATRLYESVGMRRVKSETSYLLEIRPGTDLVVR
jgi:mycothiol synthase